MNCLCAFLCSMLAVDFATFSAQELDCKQQWHPRLQIERQLQAMGGELEDQQGVPE
jgi:hypothetical protein